MTDDRVNHSSEDLSAMTDDYDKNSYNYRNANSVDYLSQYSTQKLKRDMNTLPVIPKTSVELFSSPAWTQLKVINDLSLRSKDTMSQWMSGIQSVIDTVQTYNWWERMSWVSVV